MFLRCISIAIIIFSMFSSFFSLGSLYITSHNIRTNYSSPLEENTNGKKSLVLHTPKYSFEWTIFDLYFSITVISYISTFIGIYAYKEASKKEN